MRGELASTRSFEDREYGEWRMQRGGLDGEWTLNFCS